MTSDVEPTRSSSRLGAGVALEGITKAYGDVNVLHDVSMSLETGRIHGLVGENGAGKSTLVKILCGVERPDSGSILIDGSAVSIRNPMDALEHQISIISQELATVPSMTVVENVFLGDWAARLGSAKPRVDRRRFQTLCDEVGFRLEPNRKVGTLSLASQQQVEILRAVSRGSRVLVMDEPTAVLTDSETRELFGLVRRLSAGGVSIVLVSHFLEEVLEVCDFVTVLRDGYHVLTDPVSTHTPATLVKAMVGRAVDSLFPELPTVSDDDPTVLEVNGLGRGESVHDIDLTIRAGEIVGLAGLVGSGRSELARLIFGADRADAGEVKVAGGRVRPGSPRAAMRAGIAMVPESRKDQGLLLMQSVHDNVLLANLDRASSHGVMRRRQGKAITTDATDQLDVRGANRDGAVWTLSGGNQQKVLFARWLARRPKLLIIDEPTRGVDVGAKVEIRRLVSELARGGVAILLISSDTEEVIGLSHRILVLRQGRISAEVSASEATHELVLDAAFSDPKEPC